MTRLLEDVTAVERMLIDGVEQGVTAILQMMIVFGMMCYVSFKLTLFALSPALGLAFVFLFVAGFGYLASDPSTRVASLWEEHGVLRLAENARGLRVGDRVSIVPNHVCTAVNLHDRLVAIHDDRVEVVWTIAARGRIE